MRGSRTVIGMVLMALAVWAASPVASGPSEGVLLLAHGGSAAWDANVAAIAADVNRTLPTEVALGMATRANIQRGVDALQARGVSRIVAVPLFVSSHSTVIDATQYLLRQRAEMPPALSVFARMAHGHGEHAGHGPDPLGTTPVDVTVPIRMTTALDGHPLVAAIVADRAAEISETAAGEAVVLVAHGPVADDVNEHWLVHLRAIGRQVAAVAPYAAVDAMTVRDDAPAEIRDAATSELRALVTRHVAAGRRVLVVPVLLSYGGIEAGIRERLDGLSYVMAHRALAPDPRLAAWVLDMAGRGFRQPALVGSPRRGNNRGTCCRERDAGSSRGIG